MVAISEGTAPVIRPHYRSGVKEYDPTFQSGSRSCMHGKNETTIGDAKSQKKVVGALPCFSGGWRKSVVLSVLLQRPRSGVVGLSAAGCVNLLRENANL